MHINYKNIRIISGLFKGQVIKSISVYELRPTMSIIKETVFNWLAHIIPNATCLDCFSGSGALSIESISRNAKYVTALEKNTKIIHNLKNNIKRLNIKNISIIHTDALLWLKKTSHQYDIIFLDPPYHENTLQKTINLIKKNHIIKKSGYIYIETKKKKNIKYPKNWILFKNKYINNINYKLYIFNEHH